MTKEFRSCKKASEDIGWVRKVRVIVPGDERSVWCQKIITGEERESETREEAVFRECEVGNLGSGKML